MFDGMLIADKSSMFLTVLLCAGTAVSALMTPPHQAEYDWESGEYYSMLLLSLCGMVMMAMAGDLVATFLGLETMSLAVYVLCASRRTSRRSTEGAMKYFLMGAFASAFLIYGIALVYGATGTTDLRLIAERMADKGQEPLVVVAVILLVVSFGFKVAAVPFHMWAPDAYEGAPTPVTGFMAAVVKGAAFAGALRVFGLGLGGDFMPLGHMGWGGAFAVIAAITMTVGNLAALRQENVKRMLAYSSIAHTGYMLVGLAAWAGDPLDRDDGIQALLFYGVAYAFMNLGAFAVIAALQKRTGVTSSLATFAGLGRREPILGILMTLFMLSLIGIPPTAGFFAKANIILAAVEAGGPLTILAFITVINAAVAAFYYLRVVVYMFMRDSPSDAPVLRHGALLWGGLVAASALTILLGLFPEGLLEAAATAAQAIVPKLPT
jgi:NADH-quinone oxidoreductase subunit N